MRTHLHTARIVVRITMIMSRILTCHVSFVIYFSNNSMLKIKLDNIFVVVLPR